MWPFNIFFKKRETAKRDGVKTDNEHEFIIIDSLEFYNLNTEGMTAEVKKNSNKYTGRIVIPSIVVYNDEEYSVTSIGERAFEGCEGLTTINIPNSVTNIGEYAFNGCKGLTAITVDNSNANYSSEDGVLFDKAKNTLIHYPKDKSGSYSIPNSVKNIGDWSFYDCRGLTSITIPNSVTSIGGHAFAFCDGITSIIIPNSVTSIGENAFYCCKCLTSITIPNGVTSIEEGTFEYCEGLTSIDIPNSVTSIGERSFSGCKKLSSITIPNSVTSIGEEAFAECKISTLIIPNSVKIIGCRAFEDCTDLNDVTIGNGIIEINYGSFSGCYSLRHIYCISESVPRTSSDAFIYSSQDRITLHVLPSSVDKYKAKSPWNEFEQVEGMMREDVVTTKIMLDMD